MELRTRYESIQCTIYFCIRRCAQLQTKCISKFTLMFFEVVRLTSGKPQKPQQIKSRVCFPKTSRKTSLQDLKGLKNRNSKKSENPSSSSYVNYYVFNSSQRPVAWRIDRKGPGDIKVPLNYPHDIWPFFCSNLSPIFIHTMN